MSAISTLSHALFTPQPTPPASHPPEIPEDSTQTSLKSNELYKLYCPAISPSPKERALAFVKADCPSALQDILSEDQNLVKARYESGQTLLHIAAEKGRTDCIKALLEAGASTLAKDTATEATPLHLAAQEGNLSAVQQLATSENIHTTDRSGRTPLHRAALRAIPPMGLWSSLGRIGDYDSLNKPEIVRYLHTLEADLNAQDDYGQTPLHIAASCNNSSVYQTLISLKARTDIQDRDNKLPSDFFSKASRI